MVAHARDMHPKEGVLESDKALEKFHTKSNIVLCMYAMHTMLDYAWLRWTEQDSLIGAERFLWRVALSNNRYSVYTCLRDRGTNLDSFVLVSYVKTLS